MTHASPIHIGRRFNVIRSLPPEVQNAFFDASTRRRYAVGQEIYHRGETGDEMYRIVEGMVRLTVIRRDGQELVFCVYQSEDCFGVSSLIDGGHRPSSADAITNLEVNVIKRANFELLRSKYRIFDDALLRLLCSEVSIFGSYIAHARMNDLQNSLARRLLDLARSDSKRHLILDLSQAQLALVLGASRQTTNKLLRQFESKGLISLGYNQIAISNLPAIKKLAKIV